MIYKEVTIYIPLAITSYTEYFGKISRIAKELENLSGKIQVKHDNREIAPLDIKYFYYTNSSIKKLFPPRSYKFIRRKFYSKHFIQFRSKITILNERDFDDRQDIYINFEYQVKSYVRVLLIYMNLAKPGGFKTTDGKVIIKEKLSRIEIKREKFEPILSIIGEALELREKLKWPPVKEFSIKQVFDFIENHWTAFQKTPNNRIQIALNAFSYLFHEDLVDNAANDLFYSVLGIEALFVSGHDNIQKQVDKKTQILFGERTNFKKRFNELYDFRSRYIHGQLNIVNNYFTYRLDDEVYNSHMGPLYDNTCFAVMILLASIQKHIELNKSELEFEYKLKE